MVAIIYIWIGSMLGKTRKKDYNPKRATTMYQKIVNVGAGVNSNDYVDKLGGYQTIAKKSQKAHIKTFFFEKCEEYLALSDY